MNYVVWYNACLNAIWNLGHIFNLALCVAVHDFKMIYPSLCIIEKPISRSAMQQPSSACFRVSSKLIAHDNSCGDVHTGQFLCQ